MDLFGSRERQPAQRSHTSDEAAASVRPIASRLRARVYAYLRACGGHGAIDEEGVDAVRLQGNCYRPRRIELVKRKLVVNSGTTRRTRSGRRAIVWIARTTPSEHPNEVIS